MKEIEKTVENKEETMLNELKSVSLLLIKNYNNFNCLLFLKKDATIECIRNKNERLSSELQHLQDEIQRLQLAHETTVSEARTLKFQLDKQYLVGASTVPFAASVRK